MVRIRLGLRRHRQSDDKTGNSLAIFFFLVLIYSDTELQLSRRETEDNRHQVISKAETPTEGVLQVVATLTLTLWSVLFCSFFIVILSA